eukprot:3062134-Amphidinium_carterae.3
MEGCNFCRPAAATKRNAIVNQVSTRWIRSMASTARAPRTVKKEPHEIHKSSGTSAYARSHNSTGAASSKNINRL